MRPNHFDSQYRQRLAAGQVGWNEGAYDDFELRPFIEQMLAQASFDAHPPAALDLGCGTGQLACMLAALGFAVTALDIAPTAIEFARMMAAQRCLVIDFRVADLSHELLPNQRFDVVIDSRLLHCIVGLPVRAALLRNVHHALKGTGEFWSESMVGRPKVSAGTGWRLDDEGVFWKAAGDGRVWTATRHIPPSANLLLGEFRSAGFEVIWCECVPPVHDTDVEMLRSRCRLASA
jgi:SAM-dependent methyltransferase